MVARLTSEEAIAWSVQAQPSQSISSKSSSSPQASNSSAQDSSVHMRMAYSMAFGPCWEPPRTECSYAPSEAGVEDREELLVAAVHVVGDAAAVALRGEREQALHAVAVGLDYDFFLAVLHGGG